MQTQRRSRRGQYDVSGPIDVSGRVEDSIPAVCTHAPGATLRDPLGSTASGLVGDPRPPAFPRRRLIAVCLILFMVALETVWRRPTAAADPPVADEPTQVDEDTEAAEEAPAAEEIPAAEKTRERFQQINEWLESGDTSRAVSSALPVAEALIESNQARFPAAWTTLLATVARAAQQAGDQENAAELFHLAVQLSERVSDRGVNAAAGGGAASSRLTDRQRSLIRLAAASALLAASRPRESIDSLRPVVAGSLDVEQTQRRYAARLLLAIGSESLRAGQQELARDAYQLVLSVPQGEQRAGDDLEGESHGDGRATAMLGSAWALATLGSEPVAAAEELSAFVKAYPQHRDAPRAAEAAATCLAQAGRDGEANEVLTDLLKRWPDSATAAGAVREHLDVPAAEVPDRIVDWLTWWSRATEPPPLETRTLALGLRVAADRQLRDAWQVFADRLAASDESGETTTDLLRRLNAEGHDADAERLAARFIAPESTERITSAAREAACLWAGRKGRWSMLALASESQSLVEDDPTRSVTVERLFAEALTQTERGAEAQAWWVHLVDVRGLDDFPTLLRCAETAVPVADVAEVERRIEAAREAADGTPERSVLVDALAAELAIRRARFEQSRTLLEGIVRSAHSPSSLRGRAQWLIGETHYLQQQFPKAIEAYRRVEGVDDSGLWIPAALVQAGKSFEQLGRTRDASVCYLRLMNRFTDSEHAASARRRLAVLTPDKLQHSPSGRTKSSRPDPSPTPEQPARAETLRR